MNVNKLQVNEMHLKVSSLSGADGRGGYTAELQDVVLQTF